jgi:glycerol-3-phosphate cytidylyltransferase
MDKKPYRIGYTQGVYDMFHVGHLNLLQNAKKQCDKLIVGVNSDRLVMEYKHKKPVISEENRLRIVENIKAVDEAVIVDTLDKLSAYRQLGFDAVFIGDDWKGNSRWEQTGIDMKARGVDLVYLPHTQGISSTELRPIEQAKVDDQES